MELRECKQCKQENDLTPANFYVDSQRGKNGYQTKCKLCESAKRKELYEANKDDVSTRQKNYREANKEKLSEQRKRNREANKEKINERQKQHREANKVMVTCECGAEMLKENLARHLKNLTTQHENYLLHRK